MCTNVRMYVIQKLYTPHTPPRFSYSCPRYFDVSVRNPLQPAFISVAVNCVGVAAEAREQEKINHHKASITAVGGFFYSLVVEILGCWTPAGLEMIR